MATRRRPAASPSRARPCRACQRSQTKASDEERPEQGRCGILGQPEAGQPVRDAVGGLLLEVLWPAGRRRRATRRRNARTAARQESPPTRRSPRVGPSARRLAPRPPGEPETRAGTHLSPIASAHAAPGEVPSPSAASGERCRARAPSSRRRCAPLPRNARREGGSIRRRRQASARLVASRAARATIASMAPAASPGRSRPRRGRSRRRPLRAPPTPG